MTEKQQRIAIAEACGWTNICLQPLWVSDIEDEFPPVLCGTHPSKGRPEGIPKRFGPLPDYLNDLNAMHEAEKMLRKPMKGSDTDTIIGDRMHKYAELIGYAFDATAAQRAEAFLKTIVKWEEAQ
jgi:hypothetical protein